MTRTKSMNCREQNNDSYYSFCSSPVQLLHVT
jgi:hypothetical protein